MADSLNSANPIAAAGGFAGRAAGQQGSQAKAHSPRAELATAGGDAVELSAAPVRQLLRERILARTRVELGLAAMATGGPEFAEAIDSESVAAFVGRLLSAQNQLAVSGCLPGPGLREALDRAFHGGVAEATELLGDDARSISEAVLAVYRELLRAVVVESERT
jgi:hypothetical protein